MSELEQAHAVRSELMEKISHLDIAGYLKSECEYFLKHLNSYKMENLKANFPLFKKYILLLDDQQTKQVKLSLAKAGIAKSKIENIDFFFSRRGQRVLGDKVSAIAMYSVIVQKIMQKIKAIFLFQATEFVNGSQMRMKVVDFKRIQNTIMSKCKSIVK